MKGKRPALTYKQDKLERSLKICKLLARKLDKPGPQFLPDAQKLNISGGAFTQVVGSTIVHQYHYNISGNNNTYHIHGPNGEGLQSAMPLQEFRIAPLDGAAAGVIEEVKMEDGDLNEPGTGDLSGKTGATGSAADASIVSLKQEDIEYEIPGDYSTFNAQSMSFSVTTSSVDPIKGHLSPSPVPTVSMASVSMSPPPIGSQRHASLSWSELGIVRSPYSVPSVSMASMSLSPPPTAGRGYRGASVCSVSWSELGVVRSHYSIPSISMASLSMSPPPTGPRAGSPSHDDLIESDRQSTRLPLNTSDMCGMPDKYAPSGHNKTHYHDTQAPAIRSTLSLWYHSLPEVPELPRAPDMLPYAHPSQIVTSEIINEETRSYVLNIVKIQFPFGNPNALPEMIWQAIIAHNESREAVSLLSKAYYKRKRDPTFKILKDADIIERVRNIGLSLQSRHGLSANDAMAALHIVSLCLLDGSGGKWDHFLHLAALYVRNVLEAPLYRRNYPQALEHASPKDQFVIKTTIWFDVIASITTQERPKLIDYIRELFKPDQSRVGQQYTYSMLDPMGCENIVVWALAETLCLSYWKRRQERTGDLSIQELIPKASEIDQYLATGRKSFPPQPDERLWRRFLASEIFRTSAKLFLKVVEIGDYRHIREVRACVDECYEAIMHFLSVGTALPRSTIMRSTVFGVFICGALTGDPVKQNVLRTVTHLMQNTGQEGVGSVSIVRDILEKIWNRNRQQSPDLAVQWRAYLSHYQVLLV